MAEELYDEAVVDVVGPETILSEPYPIKVTLNQWPFSHPLISRLRICFSAI